MPKSAKAPRAPRKNTDVWCEFCQDWCPPRRELRHRTGHASARLLASKLSTTINTRVIKPVATIVKSATRSITTQLRRVSPAPSTSSQPRLSPIHEDPPSQPVYDVEFDNADNSNTPAEVSHVEAALFSAHAARRDAVAATRAVTAARAAREAGKQATVVDADDDSDDGDSDSSSASDDSEDLDDLVSDDDSEFRRREEEELNELEDLEWQSVWANFEDELTEDDLAMLRAFTLKTEDHLSEATFDRLRFVYPSEHTRTYKSAKSRVRFLSAFNPVPYDCCIDSCCAYTGPLEEEDHCPHCNEPRRNGSGKPRKRFMYMPFATRLVELFKNPKIAEQMKYRDTFATKDGIMTDIYDGRLYQELRQTNITIGEQELDQKYFADRHDVALGLSTDGFCPFKRRKQTCWPLILFNYNLPPEIRFLLINIICIGIIPGPKKPKDFDSFLWPMVEELFQLLDGVEAFDISEGVRFALRAFLVLVFGDMPAMAMVMRMKGPNGKFPCRGCSIEGVRVPKSKATTHYVPLHRARHPDIRGTTKIKQYDPANLPARTHAEFMEQAASVQYASPTAESERRAKASGIKGIPLLSHLPTLKFPDSFPLDFMHLMYENTIKNLIQLWTSDFKGLDEGSGDYKLRPTVWSAIGKATAESGATIPSAYGARPQNIALPGISSTADAWSFWSLYIGPVLLRGRFEREEYYKHFIELVKLIHICLQFEYTKDDIEKIRVGFQKWVKQYEKLYYQYSPDRLSTCPTTIHSLLHIADGIEACGPVWAYWAFPMERFCGILLPCIKSRRFPFANLDSHVLAVAQLAQIKNRFNAHEKLSLRPQKDPLDGVYFNPSYPTCVLVRPSIVHPKLNTGLYKKIIVCLATRYDAEMAVVRKYVDPAKITAWAKVRRLEGGDTMNAASMGRLQEDSRDATHVRYELLVDANAHKRQAPVKFIPTTYYGQLQHIFVVEMPAAPRIGVHDPETLILAAIKTCNITHHNDLDMHYYEEYGRVEVVDISTVQCLVGRIKDRKKWAIVDRSGDLARPIFEI